MNFLRFPQVYILYDIRFNEYWVRWRQTLWSGQYMVNHSRIWYG